MTLTRGNIQWIFIFLLAAALILSFVFRTSKPIDVYEDEIKALRDQNKKLVSSNDSIQKLNGKLQIEIDAMLIKIDSTLVMLNLTDSTLKELENKRNAIPDIVNNMDGSDVASSLTEYLKGRN